MLSLDASKPYKLVQSVAELPDYRNVTDFYGDFETNGLHPYLGHRACGVAVSVDSDPNIYYVPMRHQRENLHQRNLDPAAAMRWFGDCVKSCKNWRNHGIKFDAHVAAVEGAECGGRLVDTLTAAKLLNSDRFTYGLATLNKDWLGHDMAAKARMRAFMKNQEDHDMSKVPIDIAGFYACDDVWHNRELDRFIVKEMPPDVNDVWSTEIDLTSVLYDAERRGMRVDMEELEREKLRTLKRIIVMADELARITKREINPKSGKDVFDLLINQYGLPVLAYTPEEETEDKDGNIKVSGGNPSFDKKAMAMYLTHPAVMASEDLLKVVTMIDLYRKEIQYMGLYIDSYMEHQSNGVLHPFYNQCVRTGRMSASDPNPQQLNTRAKKLIHPEPGYAFLGFDYSQIEYRLIVHYISDNNAIQAYRENPDMDFHQWVADLIGVKRKAGKTLNFGMGYGMGKAKLTKALSTAPEIVEAVSISINEDIAAGRLHIEHRNMEFQRRCEEHAVHVYEAYHENLPNLKRTSYRASDKAKHRGYVFNAYGRRRHLPPKAAHKAFNSVIQSCAADVMKERTVACSPRFNKFLRDRDIHIIASVHDETVFMAPISVAQDPDVRRYLRDTLEDTRVKFDVPIYTEGGYSERDWAEASSDDAKKLMRVSRDLRAA